MEYVRDAIKNIVGLYLDTGSGLFFRIFFRGLVFKWVVFIHRGWF
jgi:hypothetical protein